MEEAVKLKKQLTRTRILSFVLLVFCVMFLVFAYIQKLDADRQRELSYELEKSAEVAKQESARLDMLLSKARNESEAATQALEECKSKK